MATRKIIFAASERNKDPILQVLGKYLSCSELMRCLELASGTGQHVTYFACHFPNTFFQPSDFDSANVASIDEYIKESRLANVRPALLADVLDPIPAWNLPFLEWDVILNINMIHISPWECTVGLFQKAGNLLKNGGLMFTYGAYAIEGKIFPDSNVQFDAALKASNPAWGLRDIEDLKKLAAENCITLEAIEPMPSNNYTLVWRKTVI